MRIVNRLIAAFALVLATAAPIASGRASSERSPHRVTALKITVLSTMLADGDELGEWGYSALVEVDGRKILFDAGTHPDLVLRNAQTLGIDLSQVEDVVLSHNHGDHVGGLLVLRRAMMARNPKAFSRIHVGAGIFDSRIGDSRQGEGNGLLPLKAAYEATGGQFIIHDAPAELAPGVWITGPVPRPNDETNWGAGLMLRTALGPKPDNVREDSSLVFAGPDGMVILTGCGHAGIVNITQYAEKISGEHLVTAIVGGLHLYAKPDAVVRWTAAQLARFHPRNLLLGHCTGIEATYALRQLLGLDRKTAVVSAVGSSFDLANGIAPRDIAA